MKTSRKGHARRDVGRVSTARFDMIDRALEEILVKLETILARYPVTKEDVSVFCAIMVKLDVLIASLPLKP